MVLHSNVLHDDAFVDNLHVIIGYMHASSIGHFTTILVAKEDGIDQLGPVIFRSKEEAQAICSELSRISFGLKQAEFVCIRVSESLLAESHPIFFDSFGTKPHDFRNAYYQERRFFVQRMISE